MSLKQTLLGWMRGETGEDFSTLALEVFRYQFNENIAYRKYCETLGIGPSALQSWREIPAVPTDIFKIPEIALRCFPREQVNGYFLTSGTTREIKGKHEYRDLELYEAAVLGGWREAGLPEIEHPWFFSQRSEHAPHSSLVRMFKFLSQDGQWLIDENGNIKLEAFQPSKAAQILGTSLALLKVCETTEPMNLPDGSWIFETGGSKGLRKSVSPEDVRRQLTEHFNVPEARILNEYGMTELFSQFYKWGNETTHKGPPWVGIRVLDVYSGKPAPLGTMGYLEIIDLANLDTVAAIRTQDLAIAIGDREFILIGRDPEAIPRGCSRGSDDLLNP